MTNSTKDNENDSDNDADAKDRSHEPEQVILDIVEDFQNGAEPFDEDYSDDPLTKAKREMTDDGVISSDEELARFITLNMAMNVNVDAQQLSNRVRGFWREERWIFEPDILVGEERYDELCDLFKGLGEYDEHPVIDEHGLMRWGKRAANHWYVVAYTLYHNYESDALVLLDSHDNNALELRDCVQNDRHESIHENIPTTKQFPGLGGDKNSILWPREIHDHVRSLEDIALLPMPVDTHIVKTTNRVFGTDYTTDDKNEIGELYHNLCKEHGLTATRVDKPLWAIGTYWDDWGQEYLEGKTE